MKNILIINFRKNGDIFSSASLIKSLKEKESNTKIYYLSFLEMKKAVDALLGIEHSYFIDRKKIITINKCDFISKGFSIEYLFQELKELSTINWNNVINFSNDHIGSYITSFLSLYKQNEAENYSGVRFNSKNSIEYSNDWAIVFNDILTEYSFTPIHFTDCYLKMNNLSYSENKKNYIKNDEKNSSMAREYFTQLRNESSYGEMSYFVGIQLSASTEGKSLSQYVLKELIRKLHHGPGVIPILLIAPTNEERKKAEEICSEINESTTIVEADFKALSSVFEELDFLITPDTSIKHLADIKNLPLLEISMGDSPIFKQSTRNLQSYLLSFNVAKRKVNKNSEIFYQEEKNAISAYDIYQIIELKRGIRNIYDIKLGNDISLYIPSYDELGINYVLISGKGSIQEEAKRNISRLYLAYLFDLKEKAILSENLEIFMNPQITPMIKFEIEDCEKVSKMIVLCLRQLKDLQTNKNLNTFFLELEEVLNYATQNKLISIPVLLLRARIESLSDKDWTKNINEVEHYLYEIKNDAFKLHKILEKMLSIVSEQTKDISPDRNFQETPEISQ